MLPLESTDPLLSNLTDTVVPLQPGKKRKRPPPTELTVRKKAKKKTIRAPTALQLFKDDRAHDVGKKDSSENEKASAIFNSNQSIQDNYKQISEHIAAELETLKIWEADMKNWNKPDFLQDCDIIEPNQFESHLVQGGEAQFLQSMQIFGTREEDQRESFEEKYNVFMKCNGIRLPIPQCGGLPVDLFALYRQVVLRGGFAQCIRDGAFPIIGRELTLRGTDDTLAFTLRIIFFKYLFPFEQDCQIVATKGPGKKSIFWEQDYSGSSLSRMQKENILIPRPNALSSDNFGPAFMKDAAMCLLCREPDKVKWALNRLMFASYQSHDHHIAFIQHHTQILDGLLALCGIPNEIHKVSPLIPLFNEWAEKPDIANLAMDFFSPPSDLAGRFELSALQVLSNISLTEKNQVVMIYHPHLVPGLLRKIATSNNKDIKKGSMTILSHVAWRISLKPCHREFFSESIAEGLSVYAFENKNASMRDLAEKTLKFISGLAANEVNAQFLMENISDKNLTQASEFILSTDLNIREAALECLSHLSTGDESFTKRIFYATPTLMHLDSIIQDKEIPERIQKVCAFLLPHLLSLVAEEERARKYSLHFCTLMNVASKKIFTPYSTELLTVNTAL